MTSSAAMRLALMAVLVTQACTAMGRQVTQDTPQRSSPLAQASEEEELSQIYGDKETVSIATGSAQSLRRAPAVATVITAQDIAAMGATDLDQVLESVPGVHVARAASMYAPLYVVRGIVTQYTPQLLVLQNGIPVTTLFQGNKGNLWGGYPVEHIARIEIIRGPGSALYGSDAFSGVIKIITKSAADAQGTDIGGRIGSFNSRDAWVQHGGKAGPADYSAYIRVGETDGFDSTIDADAQTRNDALFGTHASLAPGQVQTGGKAIDANFDATWGNWRLRAGYKERHDLGSGAGVAYALDPVGKSKSERITSDLSWTDNQFAKDWALGVSLSSLQYMQLIPTDYQLLPPGARLPTGPFPLGMFGAPETWERQFRLGGFASYTGIDDHHIRIGIGHDDLDLYRTRERRNFSYSTSGTPIPLAGGQAVEIAPELSFLLPHRRRIDYVYLQDEWRLANDWSVTAGVRHDRYSDFGGTTNPRVAVVWDAALNLTAKLLYGRAFRAPAFIESYGMSNPVALGNPNLKPETNNTIEGSVNWQVSSDALLNVTVYHYAMNDIIRAVPNTVPNTGSTYANRGAQNGKGLEVEGTWDVTRDLRLTGSLALQRSIDETTHTDAGYAPRKHLFARADWHFAGDYQASLQANWVADRRRPAGDARTAIPDYTTVDLALRTKRGWRNVDFTLALRNVFNADVREPSLAPGLALPHDLPMAPRTASLQAVYHF
ncbi:TonB-dependent receptor plug domain-containing protein [Zemynaea arenosa]|nr:TonB-dependent receptor [Massilia arenosa]